MVIYFLTGLVLGALLVWFIYFSARREIVRIEEEKQLLQQEKHIVIEFMHNLVETIGEGVKHNDLYQKIVHAAILSSGALSACLFEYTHDKTLKGAAIEGLFPPQRPVAYELEGVTDEEQTRAQFIEKILHSETFELGEGLIGSVAQAKKPLLIDNPQKDPRVVKHKDPALTISSMIIAPICFRKNLLGVLAVANPADAMPFNESDLSLVQSLAEQAGMAIHNANLMNLLIEKKKLDFDLSLASNIQGMLLPRKFPKNASLDIDAYYQPAQKIGGDLYNVFELPEKKVGVAIADVSGKGIPASILMAICQTNLRHFAREYHSPAEVLKAMNLEMHPEIRQDMFITITYAIIDTIRSQVTLARAGHELPILYKYNPEIQSYTQEHIKSKGMALGMVPSEIFDEVISDVTFPLDAQDVFILYTDGITEATNESDDEFTAKRLTECLSKSITLSAKKINEHVIDAVENFAHKTQTMDDLTIVTIKNTSGTA